MTINRLLRLAIIVLATAFMACGANESILKSGKEINKTDQGSNAKSSVDQELEAMMTANFRYIFILRRRDGGRMDAGDRSVIRSQTVDANRRVASDDEQAFIVGSNYQLPPPNMKVLADRFALEDRSPAPVEVARPANSPAKQ